MLVERGDVLLAVETKSGQTVADDFFAGLDPSDRQLASLRRAPRRRGVLVYGGSADQRRSRVDVVPWPRIDAYDWCGAATG